MRVVEHANERQASHSAVPGSARGAPRLSPAASPPWSQDSADGRRGNRGFPDAYPGWRRTAGPLWSCVPLTSHREDRAANNCDGHDNHADHTNRAVRGHVTIDEEAEADDSKSDVE